MEKIKGILHQKKNIRILAITLFVCSLIFTLSLRNLEFELSKDLPKLKLQIVMISYVLQILLSSLICGMCIFHISSKNDHDKFLYITGSVSFFVAILLIINYDLVALIKLILNGAYIDFLMLLEFFDSNFKFIELAVCSNLGLGIYAVISSIIDKPNKSTVNATIPPVTKPVINNSQSTEAIITTLKSEQSKTKDLIIKLKAFLKTKKGHITIAAIIVAIIMIFVAKFVYGRMTMKEVDLTGNIELEYEGNNGEGYVIHSSNLDKHIKYDYTDKELRKFIRTITFDILPDDELSNGDKIIVTAEYDESLAKKYNIKPINEEREIEVKGLHILYSSVKEIPDKVIAEADKVAKKEAEKIDLSNLSKTHKMKKPKFISATPIAKYFTIYDKKPNPYGDNIQYLFKIKVEGLVDDKEETVDIFCYVEVNNIKEDLNEDNADVFSGTVYDSNYQDAKTEDEAKSIFKKKLENRNSYVETFK
ncbi:MAG: hypothetical protein RSD85_02650 [Erysipelotrichaceae bacterium]